MTDPAPAPDPAVPPVDPTPTDPPVAPPAVKDWEAEAKKWKEFSRKNEDAAKANAAAAVKLKEFEDRDLSDLQKAQKDAAETATELARMRRENVLLAKGIPVDLTPPAPDASPDVITEYADRLIAWRGTVPPAGPPTPRPDPSQGPQPQVSQDDAEYAAFRTHLFPNAR